MQFRWGGLGGLAAAMLAPASMCAAWGDAALRSHDSAARSERGKRRRRGAGPQRGWERRPSRSAAGPSPAATNKRRKGEGAAPPGARREGGGRGGEAPIRARLRHPARGEQPRSLRGAERGPAKGRPAEGAGRPPKEEGERPVERCSPFWNLPAGGPWGRHREQPERLRAPGAGPGARGSARGTDGARPARCPLRRQAAGTRRPPGGEHEGPATSMGTAGFRGEQEERRSTFFFSRLRSFLSITPKICFMASV